MKTLLDVKNEYTELFDRAKQLRASIDGKRTITMAKKRLQFLGQVITYLECNPQAEYLSGTLHMLKNKFDQRMNACPFLDTKNPEAKKMLKEWEKEHEIDKLKQQIRFLTYIIN